MPKLASRSQSIKHPIAIAFASAVVFIVTFLLIGKIVVLDQHNSLDERISLTVRGWATPNLTAFMRTVTWFGSSVIAGPVCGLILLWLLVQRKHEIVLTVGAIMLGANFLENQSKLFYARPRPTIVTHLADAGGYSFPSGHTMTAVITWGLLAGVLARSFSLRGRIRFLPSLVAATLIVLVGFSRIYLGVHYLTDVIGGALLAGACLIPMFVILLSECYIPFLRPFHRR